MLIFYNYILWFKVCKPIRRKYKLSVNCLLVLTGAYCYYQAEDKPFTIHNLYKFVPFFNYTRVKYYIKTLIDKSYLVLSDSYNSYVRYSISLAGLQVIKELNESYDKELVLFCSKYNIEL
jgi:hypothetical protein